MNLKRAENGSQRVFFRRAVPAGIFRMSDADKTDEMTVIRLLTGFARLNDRERGAFLKDVNLYLVSSAQARRKMARQWGQASRRRFDAAFAAARSEPVQRLSLG
ncbi:hypothetical protein WL21_04755 [Burkholderia ubonensis]|uniref:hypothetical protein n=1 Tax=Burkholderia ubonensis TaxID=101571 RepID=UPI00075B42DF|nr:hypothetical protein [Burkholderia ubonensis]KVO87696.1 hypothetical protein WJ81_15725 [Burkholderia ubonensis]KVZ57313.1 hypothetical protein WL20_23510 [Burkholderia ubonensis]KVZ73010.1 hypothetical protein WL21_04755 [Burkholderia ubonensis]